MNIGLKIRKLRIEKEITQEDLAEYMQVSSKAVSRWENNITFPDITLLPLLANIFDITVDELLDVDKVKINEYVSNLREKASLFQKSNDSKSELELWQEAYKKYPFNEDIAIRYANIMGTINLLDNNVVYKDELIKICERILEKSYSHYFRDWSIRLLVDLYSMLDNIEKADFYAKRLAQSYFETYDVVKTLYLWKDELCKSIQKNVVEFISEINRELEFIINNERMNNSLEYRRSCLEKKIKLNEVFYDNNDFGYNVTEYVFDNLDLAKMIIQTTNEKAEVIICFNKIITGVEYYLHFKPHYIDTPLLCKIKCEHTGGYNVMQSDFKNNLFKGLTDNIFNEYNNCNEYLELINKFKLLK